MKSFLKQQGLIWGGLLLIALIGLWLKQAGYGITYQDSASMPEGWYVYYPLTTPLAPGTVVVFRPENKWEAYLVAHHWLLPGALMMKQVLAIPGDFVCVKRHAVYINNLEVAPVLSEYAPGQPLPQLQLCRTLQVNEYMLMSTHIIRSFDSRYFGIVLRSQIIGQAVRVLGSDQGS